MKTNKSILRKVIAGLCLFASLNAHSGIPVTDELAIATEEINQIANFAKYVAQLQAQLNAVKSMTTGRNLGALLNDDKLRQLLPPEMKTAVDDLMKSGVMKNSANAIKMLQTIGGAGCELSKGDAKVLCEAAKIATPSNVAWLGEQVKQTDKRTQQIKSLITSINNTPDSKASTDLNARLLGEIATFMNESAAATQGYQLRKEQETMLMQQRHNKGHKSTNLTVAW